MPFALGIGIGGAVSPRFEVAARITSWALPTYRVVGGLVGPSVRYWVADHVWCGAGLGVGVIAESIYEVGVGSDFQLGYAFRVHTASAVTIALDVTPSVFHLENGEGGPIVVASAALLLGYRAR